MRIVFADGAVLDTADSASRTAFADSHGKPCSPASQNWDEMRAATTLADRIRRRKFSIKNTTGYSLNALVDFDDPFEILQHLLIGSGRHARLHFEITYRTVPERSAQGLRAFLRHARLCLPGCNEAQA